MTLRHRETVRWHAMPTMAMAMAMAATVRDMCARAAETAGIKKRRKMNLLVQKLIAPLFSKNSKLK